MKPHTHPLTHVSLQFICRLLFVVLIPIVVGQQQHSGTYVPNTPNALNTPNAPLSKLPHVTRVVSKKYFSLGFIPTNQMRCRMEIDYIKWVCDTFFAKIKDQKVLDIFKQNRPLILIGDNIEDHPQFNCIVNPSCRKNTAEGHNWRGNNYDNWREIIVSRDGHASWLAMRCPAVVIGSRKTHPRFPPILHLLLKLVHVHAINNIPELSSRLNATYQTDYQHEELWGNSLGYSQERIFANVYEYFAGFGELYLNGTTTQSTTDMNRKFFEFEYRDLWYFMGCLFGDY